nr:hypothetical protein [Iodobacter ciconiae]
MNLRDQAVHMTNQIILCTDLLQCIRADGLRMPKRAIQQNSIQRQYMIACFTVKAGALSTGIGINHPADGGAVGCG